MKRKYIVLVCISLFIMTGCTNGVATKQEQGHLEVKDSLDNRVLFETSPKRVIALSSSWAELWQLASGTLIGVSSDALERDNIDTKKVEVVGTIKDPNVESILALDPDFVILSADLPTHRAIASTLQEVNIATYSTKVESFNEYLAVLDDFTTLIGNKKLYQEHGKEVATKIEELVKKIPTNSPEKSALFLRAYGTGVKAKANEHIVCDILENCNIRNIAKKEGFALEEISMEAIMEEDPDYIFITFMGEEKQAKLSLEQSLQSHPAWASLQAVKNNNIIFLEKELYHYKPNQKWDQAYKGILKHVYPEVYKK